MAVKSVEEERNVPLATDLIRISQYRFTVSDLMRMEKIVLEKVCWKVKATTAFQFLQLYYSLIQENLPIERYVIFVLTKRDLEIRMVFWVLHKNQYLGIIPIKINKMREKKVTAAALWISLHCPAELRLSVFNSFLKSEG